MSGHTNRRRFMAATAGGLAALNELKFLGALPAVSAAEARLEPDRVRFSDDIEPLVRVIEDTPREKLLEEIAARIHRGLSYRELLAALLLAGVRNIEPRPVGFKFHSVLVINSAHLASLASPDEQRWLPIFWALDYFKKTQAEQLSQHRWALPPVRESALPRAGRARAAFIEAMDNWDEAAADVAVTALARTAGEQEIFELFARFGARDFRAIGHKAIYVANSRRTLDCIGWQYAEPVLRSLAFALLAHEDGNPKDGDAEADRSWRVNLPRAAAMPIEWTAGKSDSAATGELLATLHTGTPDEAAAKVVTLSAAGMSPQTIWDALFVGAGELLLRQRGIVALHAVTTANALHYAYATCGDDQTRRMLMLQAASFVTHFRDAMQSRGKIAEVELAKLEPLPTTGEHTVAEILADISRDRLTAARKLLGYCHSNPVPSDFAEAARVLIFTKGNDAHDYKFSSAAFEDYLRVSPEWRGRYLAASVYWLRGSGDADNKLVARTRAALSG
ncbi:MAG TPA: hypothetical protein VHV55_23110 [Pirellulales bacterium]|nr:hypothetical protein [Pirellulales bacterium]